MLAEKPRYTTEIANLLDIGQKAINEHLRIMSEFGIINMYVQKQQRGSPRKYFKVNERFKLEFTLTPGFFKVYIVDPNMDLNTLLQDFPELKELQKKVEQIQTVRRIEQYRKVCKELGEELSRLTQAKMYIETLLVRTRQRCKQLIETLELEPKEQRVLFEVVTTGGETTVDEIAEKCKTSKEETIKALHALEEKGVVRL